MNERVEFVRVWERGAVTFTELCAVFGISRPIGYKWLRRYQSMGLEGLADRSRRPRGCAHETSAEIVQQVVTIRVRHPTWGGRKIARCLQRTVARRRVPHPSTIDDILRRLGLTRARVRRRRSGHPGRPATVARRSNDLWTADFKGEFRLRTGAYCYPLTIADQYSRYLLACTGLHSVAHLGARRVFERLFREYGLPVTIRTDNGAPFATTGLARLSALSVWLIKLGIHPELTEPASPQQNGCHERMHRTLKAEATRPPAANLNLQQRVFNQFRQIYNHDRPHEALGQETPASLYQHARRSFPVRLTPPEYPAHFEVRRVSANGGLRWNNKWVNVSAALIHEHVGLEPLADGVWTTYFYDHQLGRLHEQTGRIESAWAPRPRNRRPVAK